MGGFGASAGGVAGRGCEADRAVIAGTKTSGAGAVENLQQQSIQQLFRRGSRDDAKTRVFQQTARDAANVIPSAVGHNFPASSAQPVSFSVPSGMPPRVWPSYGLSYFE